MSVAPGVRDVELLSTRELMQFILKRTGEAVEDENLKDVARRAAISHLSVSELRALVGQAGLGTRDCVTKGELRARGVEAVQRLRLAAKAPDAKEAARRAEARIGSTAKRYEVTFEGRKLGMSIGLLTKATTRETWVVVTKVSRRDIPALQPGDELLYLDKAPLAPCATSAQFRDAVLARLQDAPRPIRLTFVCGDGRWPPDRPSKHDLAVKRRDRTDPASAHRAKVAHQERTTPLPTPISVDLPATDDLPRGCPGSAEKKNDARPTERPTAQPTAQKMPSRPAPAERDAAADDPPVEAMSVAQLRKAIEKGGLSHVGVVEKPELRRLAAEAIAGQRRARRPESARWAEFVDEQRRRTSQAPLPEGPDTNDEQRPRRASNPPEKRGDGLDDARAAAVRAAVDAVTNASRRPSDRQVIDPEPSPTNRSRPPGWKPPPPPPRAENASSAPVADDDANPPPQLDPPPDSAAAAVDRMPDFVPENDDHAPGCSPSSEVDFPFSEDDDDDEPDATVKITTTKFGAKITHACEL